MNEQLLHDLDIFVMSVDTREFFRANHYSTILAMCDDHDESCAEKYEFTFQNSLADHMNPVERVYVPASELEEGDYVVGVRARTLTESDNTQAYGLAAAGGGLVLQDMSENWSELGIETQSAGAEEPDPDGDLQAGTTAPADAGGGNVGASSAPTSAPSLAPTGISSSPTPSPDVDGELVVSSGNDDNAGAAATRDFGDVEAGDDGGGGGGGGGGGFSFQSKVAVTASAAGAVLLIGVGVCFAVRKSKARSSGARRPDETGTFLFGPRNAATSGPAAVGGDDDGGDGGGAGSAAGVDRLGGGVAEVGDGLGHYEMPPLVSDPSPLPAAASAVHLPGYATAVASVPEESGRTIVRTSSGTEHVLELNAGDEVSDFYSAVDSGAVETLVSWGISRDFARVALRRTDSNVQEALQIIAEGNMDELLAIDHAEMAREGAEAARRAAPARRVTFQDIDV